MLGVFRDGMFFLPLAVFHRPEDFKSCHPHYGTPLMATVHNAVVCPGGKMLGCQRWFLPYRGPDG